MGSVKSHISTPLKRSKNKINYSKDNLLLDLHCFSCLEESICMVLPGLLVFPMWNFLHSFYDSLPWMMTKQVIFLPYNTLFSSVLVDVEQFLGSTRMILESLLSQYSGKAIVEKLCNSVFSMAARQLVRQSGSHL